jgi:hypothetical protein
MTTVGGLPAHILLVHAVVVLVPLSALLIVLVTAWPAARARLALPTAVVATVTLVSVPLTAQAGEWLEHRVPRTDLLQAHTQIGDFMLPWAIGLAVVALAVLAREWLAVRRGRASVDSGGGPGAARTDVAHRQLDGRPGGRAVSAGLAVVAAVVAVGSVLTVYEIGDSGSRAAWTGKFSQQATPRPPGTSAGG